MLLFLLQNYPLLGDYVIEKLDFNSLKRLRPDCAEVDRFLVKKNVESVKELCFKQDPSSNEVYFVDSPDTHYSKCTGFKRTDFCEKTFFTNVQNGKIYAANVRHIEIVGNVPVQQDEQHGSIGVFEGKISCSSLYVQDSNEKTTLHYTADFRPQKLHIYRVEGEIGRNILADSALEGVEEVTFSIIPWKIDFNNRADSIKYLTLHSPHRISYDEDILTFLENWLHGKQTLRRLTINHGHPSASHLIDTICQRFPEHCNLNPDGTICMKSERAVAFVSDSDRSFFFRTVAVEEEGRLKPLLEKGNAMFWMPIDAHEADTDNELNDSRSSDNFSFNETSSSMNSSEDAFNYSMASDFNSDVSHISDGISDMSISYVDPPM